MLLWNYTLFMFIRNVLTVTLLKQCTDSLHIDRFITAWNFYLLLQEIVLEPEFLTEATRYEHALEQGDDGRLIVRLHQHCVDATQYIIFLADFKNPVALSVSLITSFVYEYNRILHLSGKPLWVFRERFHVSRFSNRTLVLKPSFETICFGHNSVILLQLHSACFRTQKWWAIL